MGTLSNALQQLREEHKQLQSQVKKLEEAIAMRMDKMASRVRATVTSQRRKALDSISRESGLPQQARASFPEATVS